MRQDNVSRNADAVLEQHLFLGGAGAAKDVDALAKRNIKAIVNVTTRRRVRHPFIEYLHIAVEDNLASLLLPYFDAAYLFIHSHISKGQGVLVHCEYGVSRSPTIVIAFLMRSNSWSMQEAHDYVLSKRPSIYPNESFRDQLLLYEQQLKGALIRACLLPKLGHKECLKCWCSESCAQFAVGADHPFDLIPRIKLQEALLSALDFVLGRGANEKELDWLSGLLAHHSNCNSEISRTAIQSFLASTFYDGAFLENWRHDIQDLCSLLSNVLESASLNSPFLLKAVQSFTALHLGGQNANRIAKSGTQVELKDVLLYLAKRQAGEEQLADSMAVA